MSDHDDIDVHHFGIEVAAADSRYKDEEEESTTHEHEIAKKPCVNRRSLLTKNSAMKHLSRNELGEIRTKAVQIRKNDGEAMGGRQRLKRLFMRIFCFKTEPMTNREADFKKTQYTIEAHKVVSGKWFARIMRNFQIYCCFGNAVGMSDVNRNTKIRCIPNPNQLIIDSLYWMFRTSFPVIFLFFAANFYLLCVLFAGFITGAGRMEPTCVVVGGGPFEQGVSDNDFNAAFTLSWSTFSTVGYGNVWPALTSDSQSPTHCALITVILSVESFVGVLYAGFCGAILFGKVLRIQCHAQVLFSDPIVIKYGSGVEEKDREDDGFDLKDDEETAFKSMRNQQIPCPVLEFRIANQLFDELGGEIMDATLSCVANLNADDVDPSIRETLDLNGNGLPESQDPSGSESLASTSVLDIGSTSQLGSKKAEKTKKLYVTDPLSIASKVSRNAKSMTVQTAKHLNPWRYAGEKKDHQTIDEGNSTLIPKRIFSALEIQSPEHPFFKRVWMARHVLDADSPLLSAKARRLIRKNEGFWPAKFNNADDVRRHVQFNQILVSINGVSNVSGSDVYAQKVYDYVDLVIGYQFVHVLYKNKERVKIDMSLLNDVVEQNGGGGECLVNILKETSQHED